MASNFYEYWDQSIFITCGGPEKFVSCIFWEGGHLKLSCQKGGAYSFEDFVERGEGS